MSDIAKKLRRITPLDRRNYGGRNGTNPNRKGTRHHPAIEALPPNPLMKRVRGAWKCIECGLTYTKADCRFCADGHNKSRVS